MAASGSRRSCCDKKGKTLRVFLLVLRMAVSGKGGGPDLMPLLAVLGRERVCTRLRNYIV